MPSSEGGRDFDEEDEEVYFVKQVYNKAVTAAKNTPNFESPRRQSMLESNVKQIGVDVSESAQAAIRKYISPQKNSPPSKMHHMRSHSKSDHHASQLPIAPVAPRLSQNAL